MYCIACITCRIGGIKAEYWGETGRTGYDRGLEHLKALENMHKDNTLEPHWREHHGGGEDPSFTMKIIKQHARPLSRQIHEGIQIANFKGQILINRKCEWGCNLPPTLVIEDQMTTDAGTNENGANSQST